MPVPYLSPLEVEEALRGQLNLAPGAPLADFWDEKLHSANRKAAGQIRRALIARDLWTYETTLGLDEDLAEFERDLTLYWLGVEGGVGQIESFPQLDRLNRLDELNAWLDDVSAATTAADEEGPVTGGPMTESADYFRLGDPAAPTRNTQADWM